MMGGYRIQQILWLGLVTEYLAQDRQLRIHNLVAHFQMFISINDQ